jgi:hypothetical protein
LTEGYIRGKEIVRFVDIGGIIDHCCLNILFIIGYIYFFLFRYFSFLIVYKEIVAISIYLFHFYFRYLVAINFGNKAETHDYTSYHSTIQAAATAELTTGSDVGFSVEDEVNADSLTLGPLQGIVVSWDYKAKEL